MFEKDLLTPKSELITRIEKLRERMERAGIDAALILQNTDLFYFSGTIQQSHLYIPVEGEPLLMARKSLERARAESRLDQVLPMGSPRELLPILKGKGRKVPSRIGMELDVLPAALYLNYRKLLEGIEILDISHEIRIVRSIKSEYELGLIREAALLSDRLAGSVTEHMREGISEIELAGLIEAEARKLGHQGIIRMRLWGNELFYGHLMSGHTAAVPSFLASPTGGLSLTPAVAQGPGRKKIGRNEPVLVDYAFASRGYISDLTRIYSLGELSPELIKAHEGMLEIQELIRKEARPGVKGGELYGMALEHAASLGYGENFMGTGNERIRFIGHGVGLELDEYPFLSEKQEMRLEKNMVIALEPKLVFPGQGVVGIENIHLVTGNGLEQLNHFREDIIIL